MTILRFPTRSQAGSGLRVLHYTTWREKCGIAGYAESLIDALSARGLSNEVFPLRRGEFKYFSSAEVRNHLIAFLDFARDYDLIHIQHEFSFFGNTPDFYEMNANFFWLLDKLAAAKKPVAVTFHTEPFYVPTVIPLRQRIRRALTLKGPPFNWHGKRYFGRGVSGRIAFVHAQKSRLCLIRTGFGEANVRVIPMGVGSRSSQMLHLSPAVAKARLGFPQDSTLLSLFGFVAGYKGHEIAVRALRSLPRNFALAVVGGSHPEGGDETIDTMLNLWKKRDPERFRITGYVSREDLDLYHAATDICLAPYTDPNLASSAAITWALSSGKPVVASSIPTFREIQERTDCLALVTRKCPEELAWQIRRLAADPAWQRELVVNAQRFCKESSWAKVAERVGAAYEELLGTSVVGKPNSVAIMHRAA